VFREEDAVVSAAHATEREVGHTRTVVYFGKSGKKPDLLLPLAKAAAVADLRCDAYPGGGPNNIKETNEPDTWGELRPQRTRATRPGLIHCQIGASGKFL